MEEWRDIKGYIGHYQVSNFGNVRSIKNGKFLTLKQYKEKGKRGYLDVYLRIPGSKKTKKVHRLVAEAFIPNPNNCLELNHKDENKENNCVENLEWCDRIYNNNYGTKNLRSSVKLSVKVEQYDLSGNYIASYDSQIEASRKTGCPQSSISNCIHGKNKSSKNYIWKLVKK